MDDLIFTNTLKGKGAGAFSTVAYVKFRKLKKIGKNERYQGFLSKKARDLASQLSVCFSGWQILYSDEHKIIGLKPVGEIKKDNRYFSATALMSMFDIKLNVEYEIKLNNEVLYFDTNEHN